MWQEIQFQALHFRLSRKNPGKQSYLAIQKNGENLYCISAAAAVAGEMKVHFSRRR